ncbi:hypothetical protein DL96DRAFT_1705211 [Flagelloscypha sp. PMI_526]|nr:hypothetical protein DL96DRAFT_1705211 [Flagelloscypha sp. PMI_526]
MGRALFSTRYLSEPAVHEEPEGQTDVYSTWSHRNMFDPDSDEFFVDAEYEAFLLEDDHNHQAVAQPADQTDASTAEDAVPPMVFTNPMRWTNDTRVYRVSDASEAWTNSGTQEQQIQANDDQTNRDPASHATVPHDNSSTSLAGENSRVERSGMSLTMPIDIPRTSTPSSGSDTSAPSTPPPQAYSFGSFGTPHSFGIAGDMSPPPSFSPRLYTWGARARGSASPGSPSIGRGPLTNPSARASVSTPFECIIVVDLDIWAPWIGRVFAIKFNLFKAQSMTDI